MCRFYILLRCIIIITIMDFIIWQYNSKIRNCTIHRFLAVLSINFRENDYSITEGAPNPAIELVVTRSQRSVRLNIFPASIEGINRAFNFNAEDFINIPSTDFSFATAGECWIHRIEDILMMFLCIEYILYQQIPVKCTSHKVLYI